MTNEQSQSKGIQGKGSVKNKAVSECEVVKTRHVATCENTQKAQSPGARNVSGLAQKLMGVYRDNEMSVAVLENPMITQERTDTSEGNLCP